MFLSEQIRKQLIDNFRAELAEHIQTMTDGLLAFEQSRLSPEQRQPTLQAMFRAAHSLKGAARAVGITAIEQIAHSLEDILDAFQQESLPPSAELFTACYQGLDAIQETQRAFEGGATTPPVQVLLALTAMEPFRAAPATAAPASEPAPVAPPPLVAQDAAAPLDRQGLETIRIGAAKLDALMAQLSELHVARIRAEQRLDQVQRAQEHMAHWQKEWLAVRESYSRLTRKEKNGGNGFSKDESRLLAYLTFGQDQLREMYTLVNDLSREYGNDTTQLSLAIDALEDEIKRARMLPLSTITGPFGRMIRDLAHSTHKEAELLILGGDVELDKRVLEQIKDPLVHLLRNALDHGVETPERRQAAGKPATGKIVLRAEQVGKDVTISISDDGQGLDLEAIRRAVARHGESEAQNLTEAELTEAIFTLGVSTSPLITDVSGRGVGLDVVRRNVEALHGRIRVDWEPGAGTTFTLTLPLALTSSRALTVCAGGQSYAIPLSAIERILDVAPREIAMVGGRETLLYNERPLTVVHLSDVLGLPRVTAANPESIPVLILVSAERRMAFIVENIEREQEVVIKGLGRQLRRVTGISGATITGNGAVLLILNAGDLIKLALRGDYRAIAVTQVAPTKSAVAQPQKRILIVDDSITTRTLEKNILEAAGYKIQVATDGMEALAAIAGTPPDLVISDVSMPRLDGVGLTQQLRRDPHTAHIPVILVTSLDSPADKARGIDAGADAYIIKSRFDQNNLLEAIEQLI